MISRILQTFGFGLFSFTVSALPAQAVTVREITIGGSGTVAVAVPGYASDGAHAGVINLKTNGSVPQGFCVDPFQKSSSGSARYSFSALQGGSQFAAGAARSGGTAGHWTFEYTGALTSDGKATGLPIAAGEALTGATLRLTGGNTRGGHSTHFETADNPGAGIVLAFPGGADFETADYPGAGIVLGAVAGPGNGQAPAAQAVPDAGSTLLLFGVAMCGVAGLRKRFGFGAAAN